MQKLIHDSPNFNFFLDQGLGNLNAPFAVSLRPCYM